jgi:multidrug efflux pump subunit AcrA (membrane-fusion protein)
MLIRISLIVAIVAALAAGALNIVEVRAKINTLISQRDDEHTHRVQAENDLASTRRDLSKTQDTLKQTQQDLADAKTARDKAVADASAQTKRADQLSTQLTQVTAQRDDAQTKLAAYTATTLTPEQVLTLDKSLKAADASLEVANEEKLVLQRAVTRLTTRLAKYEGTNYVVRLPANLKGKIIAVDPKWDFVVLNVGEDQGVLEDGELLVSRDGKLVAKVIVRSVEKNRCIANIVPGWQLGEVFEGDRVIPAHPAS